MSLTSSQDTVQRSSTTRSSAVTTEHSASKVPGMHSSICWRTFDSRERGSSTSRNPSSFQRASGKPSIFCACGPM